MASEEHNEADEGALGAIGTTSLSRREVMKKGAIVGGAVVWAVPAVELVGTRVAAAQSNHLQADCSVIVPGVSTFVPGAGKLTEIGISWATASKPLRTYNELVNVASDGTLTTSPKNSPEFSFTLSPDGSTLSTKISMTDTIKLVSVVVNSSNYGILKGSYSNCNPFLIVAS